MANSSTFSGASMKSWASFVSEEYIPVVLEAQELAKVEDPEDQPFKSKYLASEKLSNLRHLGTEYARAEGVLSAEEKAECKDMLAMLDLKRGALALDTEDPSMAEKLLTSATNQLKLSESRNTEALQDAYNLLGIIWSNRDEQAKAEAYLLDAQRIYHAYCSTSNGRIATVKESKLAPTNEAGRAATSQGASKNGDGKIGICEEIEGSCAGSSKSHSRAESGDVAESIQKLELETKNEEHVAHLSSESPPVTAGRNSSEEHVPGETVSGSPVTSNQINSKETGEQSREKSEALYTMTTFYLAQVYGHLRQQEKMAEYLGITLDRQLSMGHNFDPLEWAQNCAQLSGYFVDQGDYESAVHCLSAAGKVLERADITLQSETGGDVAANVLIGWGKMHMQVIGNSRSLLTSTTENEDQSGSSPTSPLQDHSISSSNCKPSTNDSPSQEKVLQNGGPGRRKLRFESLLLPPSDALSGCDGKGGVHSYEDAVKQFNQAMTAFKGALEYYKLDGHVTEHCNILFDISTLHKYLAFLESSEGRICQLHKRRATRLEPLISALNPTAFPHIWRELTLELASINQEIMDVRLAKNRPFTKYGDAAKDAAKYYRLYLESFEDVNGKTPVSVDTSEEPEYLLAQVQLAMVCYKLYNKENKDCKVDDLISSLELYTSFLHYVEKHKVKEMDERIKVCREMAELLPTKISTERTSGM